jgi:hypothetical protein
VTDPSSAPPLQLPPAYPDRAAWGTATPLRAWQTAALEKYFSSSPKDFLAVATPGAGKTTFALTAAAELLSRRVVDRVTVVAPTEHLKTQWAEAAARAGIPIDPTYSGKKGPTSKDYVGVADTPAEAVPSFRCDDRNTCTIPEYQNPADPTGPLIDLPDPIHNFLDYSYDDCMYQFTPGQSARMLAAYRYYRSGR